MCWYGCCVFLKPSVRDCRGAKRCGTAELLESTVKKYYDSIDEKSRELDGYFAEEDWDNYCTKVHALKSTSRLIGAMEVSKMAAELEELSDKKLADEVRARHAPLMEKYRTFREKFEVLVQSEEENASDKAEISESDLNEKLSKLSDCADSFDIDGLYLYIIGTMNLSIEEEEFLKKIPAVRFPNNSVDLPKLFDIMEKMM